MDYEYYVRQFHEIEEAKRRRPKCVRVLEAVLGIVDTGKSYLRAWSDVGDVLHKESSLADLAAPFFIVTAVAHIEAAALHAAKLIEKRRDSLNLHYLLDVLDQASELPPFIEDGVKIKSAVEFARSRLQSVAETVARVKQRRDQHIAHLDQRTLFASEKSQAIEVADLHAVFGVAEVIAAEVIASCSHFGTVDRFSWASPSIADFVGSEGLQDLIYFARVAFNDVAVPSPSPRVEQVRAMDRALRRHHDE